eukprot:c51733_g1_i1 orf=64-330(+)
MSWPKWLGMTIMKKACFNLHFSLQVHKIGKYLSPTIKVIYFYQLMTKKKAKILTEQVKIKRNFDQIDPLACIDNLEVEDKIPSILLNS